jgi:hypothetical protein
MLSVPQTIIRRTLLLAAASSALLINCGFPQQSHAQQPSSAPHLMVGDVAADTIHVYGGAGFALQASFEGIKLGAHVGAMALADGRILIPDDLNKQLVVLRIGTGSPTIERRIPMPIPLPTRYAWAAIDPAQSIFAITGLDDSDSVKMLTLVNLKTYAAKQFRVDTGAVDAELNLAVGGGADPLIFLHIAERIDGFSLSSLMAADAKIGGILDGKIKPVATMRVGKGGHSNSFSPVTQKLTSSTLRGLEIATISPSGLSGARVLSWEADGRGGGQTFRQRLTFDGRHLFAPINARVSAPQWAEAEVDLHFVDLADEATKRIALAKGAVGRGGVSQTLAVYASIHPDGDNANLVDVDPKSPTFRHVVSRVPLPKLAEGPIAGQSTTGRQSRHSAITPDGRFAFVSQGGEGVVHVIDTAKKEIVQTIKTPTPLRGGGFILGVQPGLASADASMR